LVSEVPLAEPEIGSTDPNIPIDNNCTHEESDFGMPQGSGDFKDEGDECDVCDASPTPSRRQRHVTELPRFDLGTIDVDGYEGKNADYPDVDEEEGSSQANDGSTQNVDDWGHSWFDLGTSDVDRYECEHGEDVDKDEEE
jgi:hypothetical protein